MSAPLVVVDTTVLLRSEDGADPAAQAQAIAWLALLWQRRLGRVSTQVLGEFYQQATRLLQPAMPAGDARAEVRRYQRWTPWQIDHATVEAAWSVESRFGLGYTDALIVAAAQQQGCRFLLTEHLPHQQVIDSVTLLHPSLADPSVLSAT
jgi:predicted nucleic acid-binding protein